MGLENAKNGEVGRPLLGGLFLEPSVSPAYFASISRCGDVSAEFWRFRKMGVSLGSSKTSACKSKVGTNTFGGWMEDSASGQKGDKRNAGEENIFGFNGGSVIGARMFYWEDTVAAILARMFETQLERLKFHHFLCGKLQKLPGIIKKVVGSQDSRGFWTGDLVNILSAVPFRAVKFCVCDIHTKQLAQLIGHEEIANGERFSANAAAGIDATMRCMPLDTDPYEKTDRCTQKDGSGGIMLSWRQFLFLEPSVLKCSPFFVKGGDENDSRNKGSFLSSTSSGSSNRRHWTNVILALNVLVFAAQIASKGQLMFWGAKINGLIDRGQIWRLGTSALLHANIGHLMVNCLSLNSVGPVVEAFSGPNRFLAVYAASALASSATSYMFCKSPAVGASGAIFGLVGSFAVFVLRHRFLLQDGKEDLLHIARVITLNMAIGILSKGIDNWGHLGGLLGGAAVSWIVGPAWTYQYTRTDGRQVYVDKAPLHNFFKYQKKF